MDFHAQLKGPLRNLPDYALSSACLVWYKQMKPWRRTSSQRRPALFLGSVECAKLPLTEAFLELDLVACHGELLGKAQDVHYLYHTKQAEDSA